MTPKKLHRFLLTTIPSDTIWSLTEEVVVHQIVSVLKLTVGESLVVFTDGGKNHEVQILVKDKKSVTFRTTVITPAPELPRTLLAAISITKAGSFELVVQKLTEIGISSIIPLISDRTIKQAIRIDRLQKISNEALEQSGGTKKVTIHEPKTIAQCFELFPFASVLCDAYTTTDTKALPETVIFYVGPEGGWGDGDLQEFQKHTTSHLKLGDTILRTETAAIIGAHTLLWHS